MMGMLKLPVGMGLLALVGCGGATEQVDPPPVAASAAQPAPERDAGVADASVDASNGDACLRSAVVCECLPTGTTAPVTYGPECDRAGAQVVCDRLQLTGAMLCVVDAGTD